MHDAKLTEGSSSQNASATVADGTSNDTAVNALAGISKIHHARITKTEYEIIIDPKTETTEMVKRKDKIIMRMVAKTDDTPLFDIEIYVAKDHNTYGKGSFVVMAKTYGRKFEDFSKVKSFVIGNNEKPIDDLIELDRIATSDWEFMEFKPMIGDNEQLQYIIDLVDIRGASVLPAQLHGDVKILLELRTTNPSPPKEPHIG